MTAHRGWEAAWLSLTGSIWACPHLRPVPRGLRRGLPPRGRAVSEVELFLLRHWDGTPEDLAACVSVLQEEARRPLEEALRNAAYYLHFAHSDDIARCTRNTCVEVRAALAQWEPAS